MGKYKEARAKADKQAKECLAEAQSASAGVFNILAKHGRKLAAVGYGVLCLMFVALFSFGMAEFALASDPGGQVFTRANTAMQGILRQIRTISSIIAALFLTIAFLLKMFSKNQRTVDEANTWIKRIAIAWACINAVGFLLTFIQEIIGPDVALPTI